MIGPRKVDRPLVLYGFGKLGHLAEEIFNELGIPICGILTKDNYQCVFPGGGRESWLVAICVASEPYGPIKKSLRDSGWTDIVPVWDIIEAYPEVVLHNGWLAGKLHINDMEPIGTIRYKLHDRSSKDNYDAFIGWHYHRVELPFKMEPKVSLPSTLADIRARQKVVLWSDSHHTFWNTYGESGIAYIHQEGRELETIQKNMHVFQRLRPKIDVSCYHSQDGLWKIEKTLMDGLLDYQWTFRLTAYMGQGAYLYGSPEERL
jgi:hypothetical protein